MGSGENTAGNPERVRLTDRIGIGVLTRLLPRDLVDEVIAEAGRREQRRRLLPARVVVYYVLALCLFFDEGYEEVMRRLVGGLRFMSSWAAEWKVPTTGAICQARQRLGAEPLRLLFERVAVPLARAGTPGAWLSGRRLMAMDGFVLEVADTPSNDAEFGRSGSRKIAPFPQVRVVGLGECGTHAIVGAAFAKVRTGERELAAKLFTGLEPGMVLLADRGFYSYQQRWEFETSLDELEIHQRGAGRVLRSKSAEMVKQEIWALLLTHYAIRDLICQAADAAEIDPVRLSFIRSLRVIRRQVTDQAAFSPRTT